MLYYTLMLGLVLHIPVMTSSCFRTSNLKKTFAGFINIRYFVTLQRAVLSHLTGQLLAVSNFSYTMLMTLVSPGTRKQDDGRSLSDANITLADPRYPGTNACSTTV